MSDADDFAAEFKRMLGNQPEPQSEPAPEPPAAPEPEPATPDPEPVEQALLRQAQAKQQGLVDLMHPRGHEAA